MECTKLVHHRYARSLSLSLTLTYTHTRTRTRTRTHTHIHTHSVIHTVFATPLDEKLRLGEAAAAGTVVVVGAEVVLSPFFLLLDPRPPPRVVPRPLAPPLEPRGLPLPRPLVAAFGFSFTRLSESPESGSANSSSPSSRFFRLADIL